MQRVAAVFAQPVVDQNQRRLQQLWYDRGVRLFIGWASIRNTSQKNPPQDRAAQLEWRDGIRTLGAGDATYMDYPLPDWKSNATQEVFVPSAEDLAMMVNDPFCAGFYGPDEPNLSPSTGGNVWRTSLAKWLQFWRPILDADPHDTKIRAMTLAGPKLTSAWQYGYKAQDVVPYMTDPVSGRRIITLKLNDWYPKCMNYNRYGNDLPAKALRATGWVGTEDDLRGVIVECSDQELKKLDGTTVVSGVPTGADMWEQYQQVLQERAFTVKGDPTSVEKQPVTVYCFFPQAPKNNASHKFTNSNAEQWDMAEKIAGDFAPLAPTKPPIDPGDDFAALQHDLAETMKVVDGLKLDLAAARTTIQTLTEQSKENHGRITTLEERKYTVVPVDVAKAKLREAVTATIAQVSSLLVLLVCVLVGFAAHAAPIPGFRTSVNHTGFDTRGAVYVPFDSTGTEGHLKQEQVDVLASLAVKGGRDMDWLQVVTNETTTWANRSANDFSDKGITYETDVNAANQLRARIPDYQPWVNSPLLADEDHDRQLGKLWGQRFTGKTIRFGKGNETWAIFGNNLPAQNLLAARADPSYAGGDTEKAQRRQGYRLALAVTAFKQGLLDAGRTDVTVIMEVEGFSPSATLAGYQLDEMKKRGFDPVALNAHLAIGQYAAGAATDFGVGSTNQEKRDNALAFINNSLVPWTNEHRALAISEGLTPVVDAYEMRLGQYPDPSWVPFQYTPEQRQIQDAGIRALFDASGGAGAFLNSEGVYGFPWNSANQFSLLDLNRDFSSQAYQGVLGLTDFSSVPEPSGGIVTLFLFLIISTRR